MLLEPCLFKLLPAVSDDGSSAKQLTSRSHTGCFLVSPCSYFLISHTVIKTNRSFSGYIIVSSWLHIHSFKRALGR